MPQRIFNDWTEAVGAIFEALDHHAERLVRYEAMFDVRYALLGAMVASHPDKEELLRVWREVSPIPIANSSIHDGMDKAALVKADEVRNQIKLIEVMLGGGEE